MIAHWRHRSGDREAIATHGDASPLASYTPSQEYWGKVTSRRPPRLSPADIALAAFRLGVKPAVARRAIELGLFENG